MNKRTQQLLDELSDKRLQTCTCGARRYPRCWMTQTREQAVRDGLLSECQCTPPSDVYVMVKVC